jgi:hypothetical protein
MRECECECEGGDEWRLCAEDFLRKDVGIGKESDKEGLESSAAETRARNSMREKGGRRAGAETEPGVVESMVVVVEERKKGETRDVYINSFACVNMQPENPCHVKNWNDEKKEEGRRRVYLRVLDVLCHCVASPLSSGFHNLSPKGSHCVAPVYDFFEDFVGQKDSQPSCRTPENFLGFTTSQFILLLSSWSLVLLLVTLSPRSSGISGCLRLHGFLTFICLPHPPPTCSCGGSSPPHFASPSHAINVKR